MLRRWALGLASEQRLVIHWFGQIRPGPKPERNDGKPPVRDRRLALEQGGRRQVAGLIDVTSILSPALV